MQPKISQCGAHVSPSPGSCTQAAQVHARYVFGLTSSGLGAGISGVIFIT